jgi:TPR repeat protein
MGVGAMEGVFVVCSLKKIRFGLPIMALMLASNVWANKSENLLAAMESGKCNPEAVMLHDMALTGDAVSQLAFANAADKNLCGVVEMWWEYSFDWYRKSAEQGNAAAQAALAKHLATHWNRENETEALVWYQRAADQGNADAKFGLAQMYGRGKTKSDNLRKNDKLAMKLYKEAAAEGHEMSWYVLSYIYEIGSNGEAKNEAVAAYWNRKAAEKGSSSAQWRLARMYEEGRGVDQNYEEARLWYKKAAAQDDKYSQTSLAKMYRSGRGGPRDEKLALQLFHQAAEAGDSNAQFELGMIYAKGLIGMARNEEKSMYWLKESASSWNPLAIKELERQR